MALLLLSNFAPEKINIITLLKTDEKNQSSFSAGDYDGLCVVMSPRILRQKQPVVTQDTH